MPSPAGVDLRRPDRASPRVIRLATQGPLEHGRRELAGFVSRSSEYSWFDGAPRGGRAQVIEGNTAVYATIARLPSLSEEVDRISSTEQFLRELNRFGLTSVVDAGESATVYPDDYVALATLAKEPTFPVRVSNFLFAQKPGTEIKFWQDVLGHVERARNQAGSREGGYVLHGAGEVLAWSAHDYENFLAPRPQITPQAITDTEAVARLVAKHRWPIRIHATYDETISQILDVFERVFPTRFSTTPDGPLTTLSR